MTLRLIRSLSLLPEGLEEVGETSDWRQGAGNEAGVVLVSIEGSTKLPMILEDAQIWKSLRRTEW